MMIQIKDQNNWLWSFLVALFSFSVWLLLSDFLRFLSWTQGVLSQHLLTVISTLSLLLCLMLIVFVLQKIRIRSDKLFGTVLAISLVFMVVHWILKPSVDKVLQSPVIYSISKSWSIQGDLITITGNGFQHADSPGRVKVGDLLFEVVDWTDSKIIVRQPVPDDFFRDELVLCTSDEKCVSAGNFEVKNPSDL